MSILRFRLWIRPVAASALLFVLLNVDELARLERRDPGHVVSAAIWLTVTAILFVPRSKWSRKRAWAALGAVLAECATGYLWAGQGALLYVAGIAMFAAAIRQVVPSDHARPVLALFVTAVVYVRFGSAGPISLLSFGLLAVILYFGLYNRAQRNRMNALNKQRLEELEVAYGRLREASEATMRNAVLEERTRIAREMHDSVGHSLTSLIVQMQAMRYMIRSDPEQASKSLEGMLGVARQGLTDIRTSVHALADGRADAGLAAMKALLDRMKETSSVDYRLSCEPEDESLGERESRLLFRVLQEAITNVLRHSGATLVEVGFSLGKDRVEMRVRDNGRPNGEERAEDGSAEEGFGLRTMRARLEQSGGRLGYGFPGTGGFEIVAVVPRPAIFPEEGHTGYDEERSDRIGRTATGADSLAKAEEGAVVRK